MRPFHYLETTMTKQLAVYSTLTADVDYTFWDTSRVAIGQQLATERTLRINGKANLATKTLLTPRGAVTMVTQEEADLLNSNAIFVQHLKNGFVTIDAYTENMDAIISDLVPRDNSAPLEIGDIDEDSPQPLVAEQQAAAKAEVKTSATVEVAKATTGKRKNTSRATTKKDAE